MAKKKITEFVREISSDFLMKNGYELYNCEFVKEGRDWFLRVFIDMVVEPDDKAGTNGEKRYVGTEDCEKVSRFLSEKLDEADPIEQNYYLEVSSPGMDRPLITPEHYSRYVGCPVEIKLYKAVNGRKEIEGMLAAFEPDGNDYTVRVEEAEGLSHEFRLSEIARTKLAVIF